MKTPCKNQRNSVTLEGTSERKLEDNLERSMTMYPPTYLEKSMTVGRLNLLYEQMFKAGGVKLMM